jgi:ABC-type Fe3+ transport system substrate-binding protein
MGMGFRGRTARLVLAAAVTFLTGATAARAQSGDELYAKAKLEKSLVLYAGGPTAPWEESAKHFEARYPGITIAITGGYSNVLDRKIDAQIKDQKLAVDMGIFQTIQDFMRWKKAGVLANFKPAGFDKIDRNFKDKDGAYVGVAVNAHPYAYNSKLVDAAEVPRSALDFLKPQFRGKVVAAYPADDDATLYVFYHIVQKYGWGYMTKYMANQPRFIQGHLGVARSISAGDSLVTFDTIASISLDLKAQGQPQEIAIPERDGLPIWALTAAIFKAAPHPNAAKLFLSWYLEPAQQSTLGTWSVRADVPPPSGLKPLVDYKVINSYRDFMTNPKLVADLRKRFETFTGPVVNQGGVR